MLDIRGMGFWALAVALLGFSLVAAASDTEPSFAPGGTDTCLSCHEGMHEAAMEAIKRSVHGVLFYTDASQDKACESCHGPSAEHARKPKAFLPPIRMAASGDPDANGQVGQACLSCHKDPELMHWHAGSHSDQDMNCLSCHNVHEPADKTSKMSTDNAVCTTCHTRQLAETHMPSRHPIAEGVTNCVDCHNPHGSLARAQLKQANLNDNCYECHAEKRGPVLFEHAPVTEDCSTCHAVHGSVHKPLLKSRPPFLCQQCHMAAGHVSVTPGGNNLSGNANMLGKNCMNCHSEVHGSNHPSGARLTR